MQINGHIEAIEAITSLNPNGRQIDFEPAIKGTTEASYKDYVITRLSTGAIKLERDGLPIEPVSPELRRLAGELNVPTANKQGNPHNTQVLGRELIKAINAL
ncbi:hypothetical protein DFR37_104281 [Eoetvoesiella caeni]|uniref:Uncharacterized protein n=1 Tax=Eoetvoesiella caeni TaxID=645616 RepID=A0A366HEH8_9BURK|nr:hypothetical protein DFR37_104281 [Eoetvoesiella caeni]